jgi:hypothetical protein
MLVLQVAEEVRLSIRKELGSFTWGLEFRHGCGMAIPTFEAYVMLNGLTSSS